MKGCKTIMQLNIGSLYSIRLTNGSWITARFIREDTYGGFDTPDRQFSPSHHVRKVTRYLFMNESTGREVHIKSLRKIRER